MFRFGGFKASLNFSGRNSSNYAENIPTISTTKGAYRANREEYYGNGSFIDPTPKKITPSMVKLPRSAQTNAVKQSKSVSDVRETETPSPPPIPPPNEVVRPTKSTGDLTQTVDVTTATKVKSTSKLATTTKIATAEPSKQQTVKTIDVKTNKGLEPANVQPKLRKGADVSSDPRGGPSNYRDSADLRKVNSKNAKKQEKEQKMIMKKRLAQQKKNEKLAAQERAKQEKLRKEKEKREAKLAKQKAKNDKKDKGKSAPVPTPLAYPLAQGAGPLPSQAPATTQATPQYTTNTLESSISRTSGPPAYADIPAPKPGLVQNENDASGNTSFTKKVDNSDYSWDLIAEHRQQINRPAVTGGGKPRQTVMDLQYHTGRPTDDRKTTEA